ncbi:MAG: transposase [Chloroflexi bacterium]|nr:transposase [Chloroflexota bacterium]MBI2851260.1 transposase [Chloroflexota bacterium]
MVYTDVTPLDATVQEPPIVQELQRLFGNLEDAPLLEALIGPTRRGPKGHPVYTLWRCFVAKYVLGLASTAALIRELHNNPFIAEACGISSPDAIPHESTFSRFFARLSKYNTAAKVKDVSRALVRRFYEDKPGFGKRVAIDSTTLKGWVNGGKSAPSDKQAKWSVKKNTHGKEEFILGYKLHLMVDCEYELAIAANVSPGNTHDVARASNVLREARFGTKGSFQPAYVMADKGYSSRELRTLIARQYGATPVIDIPASHKRALATYGEQTTLPGYMALKKQRTAVERVFSRLKGQCSLNRITVRGLRKVTVHCYLSLLSMQVSAIAGRCASAHSSLPRKSAEPLFGQPLLVPCGAPQ